MFELGERKAKINMTISQISIMRKADITVSKGSNYILK